MPVTVEQRDNQYCVIEPGGQVIEGGCHDTPDQARDHAAAVNANRSTRTKRLGDAVKAVDGNRVSGYLVRFTSEDDPDLQGEWFSKNTEFYMETGWPIKGERILFEHGFDEATKVMPIGVLDFSDVKDIGIWVEGKLHDRREYERMLRELRERGKIDIDDATLTQKAAIAEAAIKTMLQSGSLQWSSGALPQGVVIDEDSGHIDAWPIIEGTMTWTPAEPDGTEVRTMKSALADLQALLQSRIQPDATAHRNGTARTNADATTVEAPPQPDAAEANTTDPHDSPEPQANPRPGDTTVTTKHRATRATAREVIRQAVDRVVDEELTAAVEAVAEEVGLPVEEGDAEAIAEEAASTIEEAVEEVADDEATMAMDDEDDENKMDEDDEEHMRSIRQRAERIAVRHVWKAAYTHYGNKRRARQDLHAQARKEAREAHRRSTPGNSRVGGFTGNGTSPRISGVKDLRYAHLSASDMALGALLRHAPAKSVGLKLGDVVSHDYYRAMVAKMNDYAEREPYGRDAKSVQHAQIANEANYHLKSLVPYKADELDYSTGTAQGDEWVGEFWSTDLWERERFDRHYDAMVAKGMMVQVIPQGSETAYFPTEDADPTAYTAPQAASTDATGRPETTININPFGTGRVSITPKEIKIATSFTTILEEDSVINVVAQVNRQLNEAALETRDKLMVNGDTETGTTNVNLDGGTPATGLQTPYYIASDGFRKWGVAQGRDASNALNLAQYRLTLEQLDAELRQFYDRMCFMIDPQTEMASLAIPEIATSDVRPVMATVESGRIRNVHGVDVLSNGFIPQADTDGKVTSGGNSSERGTIVLVYAPYIGAAYKRQIQLETARDIYSGANVYVMSMRVGFVRRGTNAVVASYNVATAVS